MDSRLKNYILGHFPLNSIDTDPRSFSHQFSINPIWGEMPQNVVLEPRVHGVPQAVPVSEEHEGAGNQSPMLRASYLEQWDKWNEKCNTGSHRGGRASQ